MKKLLHTIATREFTIHLHKKKFILFIGFAFLTLVSCKKDHCVSCTVQQNVTKDIIESRAVCDKESDYVQGFADGVKEKYAASDTITVVCGFTEN